MLYLLKNNSELTEHNFGHSADGLPNLLLTLNFVYFISHQLRSIARVMAKSAQSLLRCFGLFPQLQIL